MLHSHAIQDKLGELSWGFKVQFGLVVCAYAVKFTIYAFAQAFVGATAAAAVLNNTTISNLIWSLPAGIPPALFHSGTRLAEYARRWSDRLVDFLSQPIRTFGIVNRSRMKHSLLRVWPPIAHAYCGNT